MISRTSELATYPNPSFAQAAIDAILGEQHLPVDMRYFRPAPDTPADVCAREVRSCDVYVGILGHRYGSSFADRPDVSCTEFEFDVATEVGLPRLLFMLDREAPVPMSYFDSERGDRQVAFRAKAGRGATYKSFSTPEQLALLIARALSGMREAGFDPDATGSGVPRAPYQVPTPDDDTVERPSLSATLLAMLVSQDAGSRVMALIGAGGLGKSTLAQMVCALPEVRRRYPGGVLWLELTKDMAGAALAEQINDLSYLVSGARPDLTDPERAAIYLRELLHGQPDTLLVADAVWSTDQIRPLLGMDEPHRLLVTTRFRPVLPLRAVKLDVPPMTPVEARTMLTTALPDVSWLTVERFLQHTGRWPLLLSMVRAQVLNRTSYGVSQQQSSDELADSLTSQITDFDSMLGVIVNASLETLTPTIRERFSELAVFPPDIDIPLDAAELFWAETGGLTRPAVNKIAEQLAACSLLERYRGDRRTIRLHSLVGEWLRRTIPAEELATHRAAMLRAARGLLPADGTPTPWWTLPPEPEYLWRYLVLHLLEAERRDEAVELCENLSWIEAKLIRLGAGPVESDLAQVVTPVTSAARRVLTQSERLLATTEPPDAVLDTVRSRLATVEVLQPMVTRHQQNDPRAQLINAWLPPDRPNPALRRELRSHLGVIYGAAAVPHHEMLVSCGADNTVRLWDVTTGAVVAVLEGHTDWVRDCAAAPDGTWLASASDDGTVRLWEVDGHSLRSTLTGHAGTVRACAIAPGGGWLASGGVDGTVRRWDARTGVAISVYPPDAGPVNCCAISRDGSRLASGHDDGSIRLWDVTTGVQVAVLPPRELDRAPRLRAGPVHCCAIDPGGHDLVAGYGDGTLRRWDLATHTPTTLIRGEGGDVYGCAADPNGAWIAAVDRGGSVRLWRRGADTAYITIDGHADWVQACAAAPDGSWLASAGRDASVRIWDTTLTRAPTRLEGHAGEVRACAISADSFWLATAGEDGAVRLWDVMTRAAGGILEGHVGVVNACAVAPDGNWLVSAGDDGVVRLWDRQSGTVRRTFTGHTGPVNGCAISRDGAWLVSVGDDATVRVWDSEGRLGHRVLAGANGHTGPVTGCAFAPDGSRLATVGAAGDVRIWDWANSVLVRTLSARTGLTGGCAIAPDGSWLAAGGADGSIWSWDWATGATNPPIIDHHGPVSGCAASFDSEWLATVGQDGTVRIWRTDDWSRAVLLRTDGRLRNVTWSRRRNRLCAVGEHGVYLFKFNPPRY